MAFVERSTKAGWLLLKALRKQDGFRWMVYESRMAFVESSTKVGRLPWKLYESKMVSLKGLRKQDGFRWKLYESKMAFFESSTKARLLSLKALRKQDSFRWKPCESLSKAEKHVNRDNTKFCDKIAYVGGPSFRRRPWPFGECRRFVATGNQNPTRSLLECMGRIQQKPGRLSTAADVLVQSITI